MASRFACSVIVVGALCLAVSGDAVAQEPSLTLPDAIEWPAPVAAPDGIVLSVLPFGDGLVATGQEQDGLTARAAAWWSADGSSWERTLRQGRKGGYTAMQHVVATPSGLVGMGPTGVQRCTGEGEGGVRCEPSAIAVWRSTDGHGWERVALDGSVGRGSVAGLAAGPLGLLAVGTDSHDVATTWRSTDGLAWTPTTLTGDGFDRARASDVAALGDGWVMVGSTGGRDVPAGGVATPNGSVGAAWTSADGIAWQPAQVAGDGEQVELRRVFVGADGLTAVGSLSGGKAAAVWVSADGTDWSLLPDDEDVIQGRLPQASDGRTIVATSFGPAGALDWWASTDGVAWRPLASTGAVGTAPRWDGGVAPDVIDVVDDRLFVVGWSDPSALLWVAPLRPEARPMTPVVADRSTPGATLHGYLEALVAGDCGTARVFVARSFGIGDGELCGGPTVHSYAVHGGPARPSPDEAVYATTLVITGGDLSLEGGPMTWFYDIVRQPDGSWLIVGGGSGPWGDGAECLLARASVVDRVLRSGRVGYHRVRCWYPRPEPLPRANGVPARRDDRADILEVRPHPAQRDRDDRAGRGHRRGARLGSDRVDHPTSHRERSRGPCHPHAATRDARADGGRTEPGDARRGTTAAGRAHRRDPARRARRGRGHQRARPGRG